MTEVRANSVNCEIPSVTRWGIVCTLLVTGLTAQTSLAQTPATPPENSSGDESSAIGEQAESSLIKKDTGETPLASAPASEAPPVEPLSTALSRGEEITQFEAQLIRYAVTEDDAADLFNRYRDETRLRLWQLEMALSVASSTADVATIDPAQLEAQQPGFSLKAPLSYVPYAFPLKQYIFGSLEAALSDLFQMQSR